MIPINGHLVNDINKLFLKIYEPFIENYDGPIVLHVEIMKTLYGIMVT